MFWLNKKADDQLLRRDNERLQAEKDRLDAALVACRNEINRLNVRINELEHTTLARQFDLTAANIAMFRQKRERK